MTRHTASLLRTVSYQVMAAGIVAHLRDQAYRKILLGRPYRPPARQRKASIGR